MSNINTLIIDKAQGLVAENKNLREALTKTEADNKWLRERIKKLKNEKLFVRSEQNDNNQ